MSLLVIYNPACGDSTAEHFFYDHVIPRIHAANRVPTEIIRTLPPGGAGANALSFLDKHKGDITIVLGSGDGTLHEIVNHLTFVAVHDHEEPLPVRIVLVPCGTANALYASLFGPAAQQDPVAYKLQSLEAFLGVSTPRPLTLSFTSPLGPHHHPPVASVVVTSTALHAAILKDSEKLRKEIPGIERFKVAAQQNITKWYSSHVRLLPIPSSGQVLSYDPQEGGFVDSGVGRHLFDIHGPFAYFLSTTNVDRLEPEFRINPTISKNPPLDKSMDICMVRPKRDPTFTSDTPQAREQFAGKLVAVLTAAYQSGNHINLRYSANGNITDVGNGDTVVECFRCGGWEWIPDGDDEDGHLVCADGAIFEIEKGGGISNMVELRTYTSQRNFHVYI